MSSPYTGADDHIPLPRLRTITHLWALAAVLASLGVAALAIDVPIARWIADDRCPSFIQKLGSMSEVFGHGMGVVMIVVVIAVLDPWHRYALPRIAAAALGSGLLANTVKLALARTRPARFDFSGQGLDSFGEWLPLWSNASWQQSFPSSHSAVAAGLAIVLACFYPRGRWLFPAIAVMAGFQRIASSAHFLSDLLWGGAIGCIFAPLCVYGSVLAKCFDRLEAWLMDRRGGLLSMPWQPRRRRDEQSIDPAPDSRAA